jgi:hypothetical protein
VDIGNTKKIKKREDFIFRLSSDDGMNGNGNYHWGTCVDFLNV